MNRFRLIILSFFIATVVTAQDYMHVCIGVDQNFGVPNTNGSTYTWQIKGNTTIASITSGNGTENIRIDLNSSGVFQLLVEENDINGCIGYDSVFVEIHNLPNPYIYANGPTTFCDGASVILQVDSLYESIKWNNNSNSSSINADSSADYFVTVTDIYGCSNISNSISVSSNNIIIPDFAFEGICVDRPTKFSNISTTIEGNFISNIWNFGSGDIIVDDTAYYTFTESGEYPIILSVFTDNGCNDSILKLVSIYDNPIANFTHDPITASTSNPEINFTSSSLNSSPILWLFEDSISSFDLNPTHSFNYPGISDVMLLVEDGNKCVDSIFKKIIIYYDFEIHIPTAFTPNDDGINDTFGPNGLRMEKYLAYNLFIYNKWGEIVFESNNISNSWNGSGSIDGTYSWIIKIVDEIGKTRTKNGMVTLFR